MLGAGSVTPMGAAHVKKQSSKASAIVRRWHAGNEYDGKKGIRGNRNSKMLVCHMLMTP